MNSSSIRDAVYYCGGNFRECEIFKRSTGLDQQWNIQIIGGAPSTQRRGGKS
jgi:hypothetical protein